MGKRPRNHDINLDEPFHTRQISAIHLAAALGDPKTLWLFTTFLEFDPLVTCHGATSLHFVVASRRPTISLPPFEGEYINICDRYLKLMDFGRFLSYVKAKAEDAKSTSYKEREACISMLVQAGLSMWQKDNYGNNPDPGISACSENCLSWQNMVERQTLEAKKSLNEAGNAISVVATASYVGPLQPPLGYADDFVQMSNLPIRIFMVTNSVSFYLAIASIMFVVVPTLPIMPQEGIFKALRRIQKSIWIATCLLLISVLGVLISFTAASNAVVSEEYSWRREGLTFYPVVVGGLVCLIGIICFFIRKLIGKVW